MLKLALRNIFRQRTRSLLTLAAIMFGVSGLILSGGFVEDVFFQLREATIHSHLGHIQMYKDGYSRFGRRDPFNYLIEEPEQLVGQLSEMNGVVDVLPRLYLSGLLSTGKADMPVVSEGGVADKESRLGEFVTVIEGRDLGSEDEYGVMLGQGVARKLSIEPGDDVTLLVNTPEWGLNSLELVVVGVFQTISKDYDDHAVRINMDAAQELIGVEAAHALVVSLAETDATDQVRGLMKREYASGGYEIRAWYELADFYQKTVDMYGRQFRVLQLIVLVMVLLSVANSVNMAVHERIGEFGTLMALGDRRGYIFRLVVTENVILGLIGGLVGVLAGVLLAQGISAVGIPMPPPPNTNTGYTSLIRLTPFIVLMAFLVGFCATTLASLLPARRVSRVPVVEALRQN